MKSSHKLTLIPFILIITFFAGVWFYFFLRNTSVNEIDQSVLTQEGTNDNDRPFIPEENPANNISNEATKEISSVTKYPKQTNNEWNLFFNEEYKLSFEYPNNMTLSDTFLTTKLSELKRHPENSYRCTRLAFLSANDLEYTKARGPGLEISACIYTSPSDKLELQYPSYVTDFTRGENTYKRLYFPETDTQIFLFDKGEFRYNIHLYYENIDAKRLWDVLDTLKFY